MLALLKNDHFREAVVRIRVAPVLALLSPSLFSVSVVADAEDQDELEGPPLKRIPVLFPGEQQLPTGPGKDPASVRRPGAHLPSLQADLERRGQQRLDA